jgi:hypothetical protein
MQYACNCIEPFHLVHVIGYRKGLEPLLVERREEVVDVFNAEHMQQKRGTDLSLPLSFDDNAAPGEFNSPEYVSGRC